MAYAHLSYDPWELEREEREKRFVGREALLQRVMGAVAEQQGHGTLQHYLLLGPRGIGKTTLLLTLRDRVRDRLSLRFGTANGGSLWIGCDESRVVHSSSDRRAAQRGSS